MGWFAQIEEIIVVSKRGVGCQPKTLTLDCVLVQVRAHTNMHLIHVFNQMPLSHTFPSTNSFTNITTFIQRAQGNNVGKHSRAL